MNILETKIELNKLAETPYKPFETQKFGKYAPAYIAPTSNVIDTMALYPNAKKVLCVGSTGAHGFTAALNNAEHVDMYDININQQIYYELIKTAITELPYEEFIRHFSLKEQPESGFLTYDQIKDLLSLEMYFKIAHALPDYIRQILDPIYISFRSPERLFSSLYRFEFPVYIEYLKKFVPYYKKEEYEKLQRVLRMKKCDMSYQIANLYDLPNVYKNEKYDLIVLDNILQTYKNIRYLNNPNDVNRFIQKSLKPMLNPDGNIQVGYAFEMRTDMVLENLGKKPVNCKQMGLLSAMYYLKEKREEINSLLLTKYPDFYDYTLIPGVECPLGEKQNLILSLKKIKFN